MAVSLTDMKFIEIQQRLVPRTEECTVTQESEESRFNIRPLRNFNKIIFNITYLHYVYLAQTNVKL